jgi:UbiD family decarboxylase
MLNRQGFKEPRMANQNSDHSPFQSLRSFLAHLGEKGELIRITREVSPKFELAAVVKSIQDTVNKAVCFEDVKGFNGTIASNLCGSHRNIGLALSSDPNSLATAWARKSEGFGAFDYKSCSKATLDLGRLRLNELPGIVFHEKDAGPYITSGIVLSKNPETGKVNLSFHRIQMTGTEELGIRLSPSGHLFANQKICEDQGKPLECAILVGSSPLIMLSAATTMSSSESELDLASHLLGKPWPLRKCHTVDLEVPEDTEIVLEGEILPHVRRTEGPFGEWMGFYVAPSPNHVFKVKDMFAQERPIHYAIIAGSKEEIMLTVVPIAGSILRAVKTFVPSVIDVVCWPMPQFCVIKMKKRYQGEEHRALLAALGAELNRILYVVVVDEDVDIYNPSDVLWAISTRCRPDQDVFIVPGVPSFARDPFRRHWGRVGIDATVPFELTKEFERKKIPFPEDVKWEDYI